MADLARIAFTKPRFPFRVQYPPAKFSASGIDCVVSTFARCCQVLPGETCASVRVALELSGPPREARKRAAGSYSLGGIPPSRGDLSTPPRVAILAARSLGRVASDALGAVRDRDVAADPGRNPRPSVKTIKSAREGENDRSRIDAAPHRSSVSADSHGGESTSAAHWREESVEERAKGHGGRGERSRFFKGRRDLRLATGRVLHLCHLVHPFPPRDTSSLTSFSPPPPRSSWTGRGEEGRVRPPRARCFRVSRDSFDRDRASERQRVGGG